VGMAMTEKQGGSDVRANTTRAVPDGDDHRLTGHKWFCSAPMSDGFLVLAQAPDGLSCFLVPRVLPSGERNGIRLQRLKDKLGNRSNASAEIELDGAAGWLVGAEGRGVATIARMVAGIEAEIFRPDDELRRLARRAVELGVDAGFQEGVKANDILRTLEQSGPAGQAWLKELATSRDPWFNINVGDGFYHYHRSWNDDLTMPFSGLPEYIRRVKAGESLERPVGKLQAERRQLIQDYRELLNTDEERAAYDQMITLAHRVFPYVEGHKFYCEHWYTNLFFNKIREFGVLLSKHGFFPDTEDVFHLSHYELEMAIIDLMTAWSNGSTPRGPALWPKIVAERRAALAEWAKHDTPPALGPVPDVIDDPAIVMLWGITRESLNTWLAADASDADNKEVRGFAASSGVVEGPACIVKSVEEIARLRKGDILVCQVTNPTWAPVFQKIAAAVSDIGGSMSHAAIVAREYGLPAVVGTGNATSRIKDGQRIRVDGGRGIVTIL